MDRNSSPGFTTEGQLRHPSKGQCKPKVHMASCVSGEPGPLSGEKCTFAQEPNGFSRPPTCNQRKNNVYSSLPDPIYSPILESTRLPKRFSPWASMGNNAVINAEGQSIWLYQIEPGPGGLEGAKGAKKKCRHVGDPLSCHNHITGPAGRGGSQSNTYSQAEEVNVELDEVLQADKPPEGLPPPSASAVVAVELGPAWKAANYIPETPPPVNEEPSLEPCPEAEPSREAAIGVGSPCASTGSGLSPDHCCPQHSWNQR